MACAFSRRSALRFLGRASVVFGVDRLIGGANTDWFTSPIKASTPFTPQLIDIGAAAGLKDRCESGGDRVKKWIIETTGSGVAFFDYDHDGWLDIFLVNATSLDAFPAGQEPTNHLYKNNRDGTFTDVTAKAGLVRSGWGQGVCVGDFNNDGFDDLFVTYWGENVLYRNNGDGTFTDVTAKAGLLQRSARPRWNTGCCFVDYDKDGNLDLFVANYVDFDLKNTPAAGSGNFCNWKGVPVMCGPRGLPYGTNLLYRNNGDGTFTDVSEKSGISKPRRQYAFTALTGDFDNDGWPDIYVACDSTPSLLYRNNHDGTFTEMAVKAGCAYNEDGKEQAGMGVAAGDYNCDGHLDLFKTNFSDDTSSLYLNSGEGLFTDATVSAGLGKNTQFLGWGCGFADLDNDGWLDIFAANGHVYPELEKTGLDTRFKERKIVYRNLRNGRFDDMSSRSGPGVLLERSSRGVAFGDFDNDGDVDIVVSNMHDPPTLLRNDVNNQNRWLKVRTIGTKSNRSGIGARVKVVIGTHSQIDEVRSGGSYLSQNDLRLHFGVGPAETVDLLEIRWPSGTIDRMQKVPTNQLVWVKENQGVVRSIKFRN